MNMLGHTYDETKQNREICFGFPSRTPLERKSQIPKHLFFFACKCFLAFDPVVAKMFVVYVHSWEAQQQYFPYHVILATIVSRKYFVLVFMGESHKHRAICCKTGYRTDVPV